MQNKRLKVGDIDLTKAVKIKSEEIDEAYISRDFQNLKKGLIKI